MGKKLWVFGMLLVLLCSSSLHVFAGEQKQPIVELTKSETLEYSNVTVNNDGTVDFGNQFVGMAPGDERLQSIQLTNNNKNTAKFYMNAQAIEALEESVTASGGAYEVKLTIGDAIIYDSEVGGSKELENVNQQSYTDSKQGIKEINESLEGKKYLISLKTGESAVVKLDVKMDGESIKNEYENAKGKFAFQFFATVTDPATNTVVKNISYEQGSPVKKVVKTVKNVVVAVKTGDASPILLYAGILAAAVILLVILGKKKNRKAAKITMNAMLLAILLLGSSFNTYAAQSDEAKPKEYALTYRVGNVGTFSREYQKEVKGLENQGSIGAVDVSDKKIVIKIDSGAEYPLLPQNTDVEKAGNYFVLNQSDWGPKGKKIERSEEYVVQYGKLVDGVEYTVQYIDSISKAQIAPMKVEQGNNGSHITQRAQIIDGYKLLGKSSQEIILTKDSTQNRITFSYESTNQGTTSTETTVITTPGGTITSVEESQNIIYSEATSVTGQMGNGNGTTGGSNTNVANVAGDDNQTGNDNENAAVIIPDEDTPLVDGVDNAKESKEKDLQEEKESVTIEDEDTALASKPHSKTNIIVGTTVTLAVLCVAVGFALLAKKRKMKSKD